MRRIEIELEGSRYLWNGSVWTDANHLTPPTRVRPLLMSKLIRRLDETTPDRLDVDLVIAAARASLEQGYLNEARLLLERVLDSDGPNMDAVALLAAVLRRQRLPRRAIRLTEPFTRRRHAPMLVERAAAFCDISDWEPAEKLVRRAISIEGRDAAPETLRVMARVVAALARTA